VVSSSLSTRAAVLALVLGILVLSYAFPLRAWLTQSGEIDDLRSASEELDAEVGALQDELSRWDDPAYVRSQARERLNVVPRGDVGALVIGEVPEAEPERPAGVIVPGTTSESMPWWSLVWDGLEEAGRPSGAAVGVPDETIGVTPSSPLTPPQP
jgi:cell division protein FtsB